MDVQFMPGTSASRAAPLLLTVSYRNFILSLGHSGQDGIAQ